MAHTSYKTVEQKKARIERIENGLATFQQIEAEIKKARQKMLAEMEELKQEIIASGGDL